MTARQIFTIGYEGATVGELPVSHWPRRQGVSKYGLGRTVRVLLARVDV